MIQLIDILGVKYNVIGEPSQGPVTPDNISTIK